MYILFFLALSLSAMASESLIDSALKGDRQRVAQLLDTCTIDSLGDNDRTALHAACVRGHELIVYDLLQRGNTVVNEQNVWGQTALHEVSTNAFSQSEQRFAIALMLLQAGASTTIVDHNGYSALTYAQKMGNTALIKLLQHPEYVNCYEIVLEDDHLRVNQIKELPFTCCEIL